MLFFFFYQLGYQPAYYLKQLKSKTVSKLSFTNNATAKSDSARNWAEEYTCIGHKEQC